MPYALTTGISARLRTRPTTILSPRGARAVIFHTRKVKCRDGRTIRVYRRADDAFPVVASKVSASLSSTLEATGMLQANLHGEARKELQEVATRLDAINRSVRERLRAAYIVFQGDPCSKSDYLAEEVRRICLQEERLREVAFALDNLVRLQAQGTPDSAVLTALDRIMDRLDARQHIGGEGAIAIEQNAERWRKETPG